jgi:hypothetical protein
MDDEFKESSQASESKDEEHKESEDQSHEENEESQPETEDHKQVDEEDEEGDKIFNEEEIQNLKDIFDLYDKDQSGKIESGDLENILTSLKRDPEEAKEMLSEIDPNHDGEITFDEFVSLMAKIENKIDKKDDGEDATSSQRADEENKDGAKRTALLDFLVLLEDYRAK